MYGRYRYRNNGRAGLLRVLLRRQQQDNTLYNWYDATGGSRILSGSDDDVVNVGLPFAFNFYGGAYNNVLISTNGIAYFSTGSNAWTNYPIGSTTYHTFISPWWDDHITYNPGTDAVYYKTFGSAPNRAFVIEWHNTQHFISSPGTVTFEAVIFEGSNDILFQYQDVSFSSASYDNGASGTIGIEGPSGQGLQYSFDSASLSNGRAIKFMHDQAADTTPPVTTIALDGESGADGWFISDVTVTLSATDDSSGVQYTEYSFDGTNWTTYSSPFTINETDAHTLYYRSADNAGNVEAAKLIVNNIDMTLPTVTGTDPVNGYVYARLDTNVVIKFSEAMDPTTINGNNIKLYDWNGFELPGAITYSGTEAVFNPNTDFGPNFEYRLVVSGDVVDAHGNSMGTDFTSRFKAIGMPLTPGTFYPPEVSPTPKPTPTLVPTPEPTATPTPEPTVTPTAEPTTTPTPTPVATPTATPTTTPLPQGDNMPMYLGILVVILGIIAIAGAAVYFLVFRK